MTRQREHDARRIAQGWRRVPVWLDPETLERVALIKEQLACSEAQAIRTALRHYG